VAVYGICQDADGRVLLTRAAPWLTIAGQWFLPGGGIDHGESPMDALRREFAEETGLHVVVGALRGVLSDVTQVPEGSNLHTIRIIYGIDSFSGTIRDEVAGSTDAAQWASPSQVWDLPLVPYVRQALTDLR
jgi:8-oxo-dGTP pyrophosphatase MutT (NUDIX family)